jgi:hypothetical protein
VMATNSLPAVVRTKCGSRTGGPRRRTSTKGHHR